MTKSTPSPSPVTPLQWLAVVVIWSLAGYGALAAKPAAHRPTETTARLIACQ